MDTKPPPPASAKPAPTAVGPPKPTPPPARAQTVSPAPPVPTVGKPSEGGPPASIPKPTAPKPLTPKPAAPPVPSPAPSAASQQVPLPHGKPLAPAAKPPINKPAPPSGPPGPKSPTAVSEGQNVGDTTEISATASGSLSPRQPALHVLSPAIKPMPPAAKPPSKPASPAGTAPMALANPGTTSLPEQAAGVPEPSAAVAPVRPPIPATTPPSSIKPTPPAAKPPTKPAASTDALGPAEADNSHPAARPPPALAANVAQSGDTSSHTTPVRSAPVKPSPPAVPPPAQKLFPTQIAASRPPDQKALSDPVVSLSNPAGSSPKPTPPAAKPPVKPVPPGSLLTPTLTKPSSAADDSSLLTAGKPAITAEPTTNAATLATTTEQSQPPEVVGAGMPVASLVAADKGLAARKHSASNAAPPPQAGALKPAAPDATPPQQVEAESKSAPATPIPIDPALFPANTAEGISENIGLDPVSTVKGADPTNLTVTEGAAAPSVGIARQQGATLAVDGGNNQATASIAPASMAATANDKEDRHITPSSKSLADAKSTQLADTLRPSDEGTLPAGFVTPSPADAATLSPRTPAPIAATTDVGSKSSSSSSKAGNAELSVITKPMTIPASASSATHATSPTGVTSQPPRRNLTTSIAVPKPTTVMAVAVTKTTMQNTTSAPAPTVPSAGQTKSTVPAPKTTAAAPAPAPPAPALSSKTVVSPEEPVKPISTAALPARIVPTKPLPQAAGAANDTAAEIKSLGTTQGQGKPLTTAVPVSSASSKPSASPNAQATQIGGGVNTKKGSWIADKSSAIQTTKPATTVSSAGPKVSAATVPPANSGAAVTAAAPLGADSVRATAMATAPLGIDSTRTTAASDTSSAGLDATANVPEQVKQLSAMPQDHLPSDTSTLSPAASAPSQFEHASGASQHIVTDAVTEGVKVAGLQKDAMVRLEGSTVRSSDDAVGISAVIKPVTTLASTMTVPVKPAPSSAIMSTSLAPASVEDGAAPPQRTVAESSTAASAPLAGVTTVQSDAPFIQAAFPTVSVTPALEAASSTPLSISHLTPPTTPPKPTSSRELADSALAELLPSLLPAQTAASNDADKAVFGTKSDSCSVKELPSGQLQGDIGVEAAMPVEKTLRDLSADTSITQPHSPAQDGASVTPPADTLMRNGPVSGGSDNRPAAAARRKSITSPAVVKSASLSIKESKETMRERELLAAIAAARATQAEESHASQARIASLRSRCQNAEKRARVSELDAARGILSAAVSQARRAGIQLSLPDDIIMSHRPPVEDQAALMTLVSVIQQTAADVLAKVELLHAQKPALGAAGVFRSGARHAPMVTMNQLESIALESHLLRKRCAEADIRESELKQTLLAAEEHEIYASERRKQLTEELEKFQNAAQAANAGAVARKDLLAAEVQHLALKASSAEVDAAHAAALQLEEKIEGVSAVLQGEYSLLLDEHRKRVNLETDANIDYEISQTNLWLQRMVERVGLEIREALLQASFETATARQSVIDLQRDIATIMFLIQEARRRHLVTARVHVVRHSPGHLKPTFEVALQPRSPQGAPPSVGLDPFSLDKWIQSLRQSAACDAKSPLQRLAELDDERWYSKLTHIWDSQIVPQEVRANWLLGVDKRLAFSRHRADMWRALALALGVVDRGLALLRVRQLRRPDVDDPVLGTGRLKTTITSKTFGKDADTLSECLYRAPVPDLLKLMLALQPLSKSTAAQVDVLLSPRRSLPSSPPSSPGLAPTQGGSARIRLDDGPGFQAAADPAIRTLTAALSPQQPPKSGSKTLTTNSLSNLTRPTFRGLVNSFKVQRKSDDNAPSGKHRSSSASPMQATKPFHATAPLGVSSSFHNSPQHPPPMQRNIALDSASSSARTQPGPLVARSRIPADTAQLNSHVAQLAASVTAAVESPVTNAERMSLARLDQVIARIGLPTNANR